MKTFALSSATSSATPEVAGFFDPRTFSVQYVVSDPETNHCAIIDPVLDYDEKSGSVATHQADLLLDYIANHDLTLEWILDTHPHADHFSAAHYLSEKTGVPKAIGQPIVEVQALWQKIYNWPELKTDGSQWDRLFAHGDVFTIGNLPVTVMHSPGHTLASITYLIGDSAFIHDTLFQPDFGTARADFPGGSAEQLWDSIQAILALPDETRLFTGHDYMPNGREAEWESTVSIQRQRNKHELHSDSKDAFIEMRQKRESELPIPKLMLHALQVNIQGGRLPEPESNGERYLKLPLNAFQSATW